MDDELKKSLLENNKCYVLDCCSEVFVWVGRVTQLEERKSSIQAVEEFIAEQNRPKSTQITRVIQGYETHSFKSNFDSWPTGSAPVAEEGRGKVAALLKQQGVGVKGANKNTPVNEEVPPLLDAGGKLEVWLINDGAKTPLAAEDIGKFYSGDYYLCYWIGKDSVEAAIHAFQLLYNQKFEPDDIWVHVAFLGVEENLSSNDIKRYLAIINKADSGASGGAPKMITGRCELWVQKLYCRQRIE